MEQLEGIIATLSFILVCIMLGEALRRRRKKRRNNRRSGGGGLGFLSYPSPLNSWGLWN